MISITFVIYDLNYSFTVLRSLFLESQISSAQSILCADQIYKFKSVNYEYCIMEKNRIMDKTMPHYNNNNN